MEEEANFQLVIRRTNLAETNNDKMMMMYVRFVYITTNAHTHTQN